MFKVSVNRTDREMPGRLSLFAALPFLDGLLMCKMNHRLSNKESHAVDQEFLKREGKASKKASAAVSERVVQVSNIFETPNAEKIFPRGRRLPNTLVSRRVTMIVETKPAFISSLRLCGGMVMK